MKLNGTKNVNYLGGIVIIAAFGVLFFFYFFSYIPKQENRLQQRAFRILKEYGNNMFDKNSYYKSHFENYRYYYAIRQNLESERIKAKLLKNSEDKKQLEEIKKVIANLEKSVVCALDQGENPADPFPFSKSKNLLYINYGVWMSTNIDENLLKKFEKYFEPNPKKNSKTKNIKAPSLVTILKDSIAYKVPIDVFMTGLKFDRLFENILLFDSSRVFYNTGLEFISDITQPKDLCDSVDRHQGGIWQKMKIRGAEKQAMVIPIDYYGKRFYLAGLISESDFHDKTRTIDSQFLILVAVFILLVLVGMPILKIIFISKNERLKSKDASASILSGVFGSGLLVLIVIGVIKHQFVDHPELENRIKQVSAQLYGNVTTDLSSIKEMYRRINCPEGKDSGLVEIVKNHFETDSQKQYFQYDASALNGMFPVNEVILIDSAGFISKAVTSTPFSELVPVNLKQRQYFINAADPEKAWKGDDGISFYIESIKSYNTGAGETSVSFHNKGNTSTPVTAITSAIPSLYRQVLPKDVEFLIIDEKGKVLYHSIKSKNLHENFLNECDFDEKLQNAMDLRTEEIMHLDYNEKEWLARIIPFSNTPLYHVTLIDLDQNNNKNSRIFLFSFYFLTLILIMIGVGMLLIRWITPAAGEQTHTRWFLRWLLFDPEKHQLYKSVSVFLGLILVFQVFSVWVSLKPIPLLLLHAIFVAYSSFVVLILLKRKELNFRALFTAGYFPENLILLVVLILEIVFFLKFRENLRPLLPFLALVFITTALPLFTQTKARNGVFNIKKTQQIYLLFLLLWVLCISVIPVIQFYYSVKQQEESIVREEQLFAVARRNLALRNDFARFGNTGWLSRIQGNGIDGMQVQFESVSGNRISEDVTALHQIKLADYIYATLPDPVSSKRKPAAFRNDSNYIDREWIKSDKLYYSTGGKDGIVSVTSRSEEKGIADFLLWILKFYPVLIVFILVEWFLLKFVSSVLFNLKPQQQRSSCPLWLPFLLDGNGPGKVLLQSFSPEFFLNQTSSWFIKKTEDDTSPALIILKASQLGDPDFQFKKYIHAPGGILWITGLRYFVYETGKHEVFLNRMLEINKASSSKVVLEFPFDPDFIEEVYDELLPETKEKESLPVLKKKWKLMLENYVSFNGFFPLMVDAEIGGVHQPVTGQSTEMQFLSIWNCLTGYEKIVLYDLADDGLINVKNKPMIRHLMTKNLIESKPLPELYAPAFRDFINKNMNPGTVKTLEKKMGITGRWKYTQYLILLFLIPLAVFILISQGFSIEKIFGIFAGILTVVTGALKLLDNQTFKTSD